MKKIYFVRHAETQAIVDGIMAGGEFHTVLTEYGRQQASEVGRQLKDKGIELIVTSPMERTRQTAELIAKQTGIKKGKIVDNELLVERAFGDYSGRPFHEYKQDRMSGQIDDSQVESSQKLFIRVNKFFEWLSGRPENVILVVSHGGIGRMFRLVDQKLGHDKLPSIPGFAPAEIDEFNI